MKHVRTVTIEIDVRDDDHSKCGDCKYEGHDELYGTYCKLFSKHEWDTTYGERLQECLDLDRGEN